MFKSRSARAGGCGRKGAVDREAERQLENPNASTRRAAPNTTRGGSYTGPGAATVGHTYDLVSAGPEGDVAPMAGVFVPTSLKTGQRREAGAGITTPGGGEG